MTSQADFDNIRRWTPLVSIDLIVVDPQGRVLLGRRLNEPAKGSWFVPGGRVRKDELLSEAFHRIVIGELGSDAQVSLNIEVAQFLGVFEHHYPASDNTFFGNSIHYIVLGYRLFSPSIDPAMLPNEQHDAWRWISVAEILQDGLVHENVKRYFREPAMIHKDQYDVVSQRRISYDNLLWQTPVLSLTAQAFLFAIAFSDLGAWMRLPASSLVILVAGASIHLMSKHRAHEVQSSKLLEEYENNGGAGFAVVHKPHCHTSSSYVVWCALLWCFLLVGFIAVGTCIWDLGRKCNCCTRCPPAQSSDLSPNTT